MLGFLQHPRGITLERRKKAMLIGINYEGGTEGMQLKFPRRDMKEAARLLKGEVSVDVREPRVLTPIVFYTVRILWVQG